MARTFSASRAKQLLREHNGLLREPEAAGKAAQALREEVLTAVRALAAKQSVSLLKDIPIEEINRDKSGFRVKALRERGYETIADVAGASVYTLAAINGIGEESARGIYRAVQKIVETTRSQTKIRLSADDKSTEAARLVTAAAKYRQAKAAAESLESLVSAESKGVRAAVRDLKGAAGSLGWLFASGEKKQRATEAFSYLSGLSEGEYGQQAAEYRKSLDGVKRISGMDAWKRFTEDPVSFYNTLESIDPSLLGTEDTDFGLPAELAAAIREQPFLPEGLKCELRPYQEWGVRYVLHQQKALLGDEMGLGKTVQAIASMVSLRNSGGTHFVVVCPASVIINWCREIAKFSDLPVTKVHGADREAALQSWKENGGVAVTTYETTGHFTLSEQYRFCQLVVDEAHYIKNPEAQRTANVRSICGHAENILFMTGTAMENRVEEMLELLKLLRPSVAAEAERMAFLSAAPQFREKIAPVYCRRKREEVLSQLPPLTETREWCSLGDAEEKAYEQAVLGGNYAEARRVSWNVEDLSNSSKAARLLEIADEAREEGRKLIVFSFFLDTIAKVTTLLGERCMAPINGSVTPQRRQEIIDEFDKAPAGAVLAAQIQSGGTGLNIQSASVVVLCEPQFKPSIENQAISRAYRMGQTRNVLVYRLLADETVDERIVDLLESKQAQFDAFADPSAVTEGLELDDSTFGTILQEERDRINAKNQPTAETT